MGTFGKDDSYAERRQLFKNIWDAALQDEDAEGIKPKVIKTLRLDDMNKYVIGKSKKERLKNLRTICNKILDFCDRQETDMIFHEVTRETGLPTTRPRKLKTHAKRKIKRRKSLYAPFDPEPNTAEPKATTSEFNEDPTSVDTSKDISPFDVCKKPVVARALISNKKSSSENIDIPSPPERASKTRRRIVKRKQIKRKKISDFTVRPKKGSSKKSQSAAQAAIRGRVVLKRVKQVLAVNNIVISKPDLQ